MRFCEGDVIADLLYPVHSTRCCPLDQESVSRKTPPQDVAAGGSGVEVEKRLAQLIPLLLQSDKLFLISDLVRLRPI